MKVNFVYADTNTEEVISVEFTDDGKQIKGAKHSLKGGSESPITLIDMTYDQDIELFLGTATSPAWEGEAFIGIEKDLSKLGWSDGKHKKTFYKAI